MQVYCLHHPNVVFLGQLLQNLLSTNKEVLRIAVPQGSLSVGAEGAMFADNKVECLVTTDQGSTLLTNCDEFSSLNRKVIEYTPTPVTQATCVRQILNLCQYKQRKSGHMFTANIALDGCTLSVKPDKQAGLLFTFKRPAGELVCSGDVAHAGVFDGHASFKNFSTRIKTEEFEKEVTVRSGQIEILREISKYIGKTLVFFNIDNIEEFSGIGVSAQGCCTFGRNSKGMRTAFQTPPNRLMVPEGCFAFATATSVREFVRGTPLFSRREVGSVR